MELADRQLLVVGLPRSGFTLLLSVLAILNRDQDVKKSVAQIKADPYIAIAGEYIDAAIRNWFKLRVGEDRLFYNQEFSILVGGPKWISNEDPDTVCVRKYLGIKGMGDCTFLLYLPKWVLAFDEIIHSHSHPSLWTKDLNYLRFKKFSSIRNPIDIIHSSVFSINALASEYIQRELECDEHEIRRELALNKLTNPDVISGLVVFLKRYLDEFIPIAKQYDYIMRWEDLILQPIEEILRIAEAIGRPIDRQHATSVWNEIDHRNLTRYHRHSFRRGLLCDWQFNITNTHLRYFEEVGFGDYLDFFGYDPIRYFDESDYTPDQKLIEECLRTGKPYVEKLDENIITFAFNKTNFIPSSRFMFKRYPREGAIAIEKSSLRDESLVKDFIEYMSSISTNVYRYLIVLQPATIAFTEGNTLPLRQLRAQYEDVFAQWLGAKASEMFSLAEMERPPLQSPRLVESNSGYNIVAYSGRHYAVPQSLGPMNFEKLDISNLPPSVLVAITKDEIRNLITDTVDGDQNE